MGEREQGDQSGDPSVVEVSSDGDLHQGGGSRGAEVGNVGFYHRGFILLSLQDSAGSSGRLRLPGSPHPWASRTLGPTPVGALVVFRKQGAEVLRAPRWCRATMDPEAEVAAPVVGGKGWGISLHPRETPDYP